VKSTSKLGVAGALVCAWLSAPHAELGAQQVAEHPFQISLVTPIQAFPEEDAIRGIRLNLLYGRNASVTGLDLGVVNHTTGSALGVQFGIVGLADGEFVGWQGNWINVVNGRMEGLQHGLVNWAALGQGVQLGFVNHGTNYRGLQIALVNYANRLNGIQLGLVNIIRHGAPFPVLPLVNWAFEDDKGGR